MAGKIVSAIIVVIFTAAICRTIVLIISLMSAYAKSQMTVTVPMHVGSKYGSTRFRCGRCGMWLGDVSGGKLREFHRTRCMDQSVLDVFPTAMDKYDGDDYRFRYCPYCGVRLGWDADGWHVGMPEDNAMELGRNARKHEKIGEYSISEEHAAG